MTLDTPRPARHGALETTPWARQALGDDAQALVRRVPPGRALWLSCSTLDHSRFIGKLTGHGLPLDARGTLEQVLDALLGPVA